MALRLLQSHGRSSDNMFQGPLVGKTPMFSLCGRTIGDLVTEDTAVAPVGFLPSDLPTANQGGWWDPVDDTYITFTDTFYSLILNKFLLGSNDGSVLSGRSGNTLFDTTTINGVRAMQGGVGYAMDTNSAQPASLVVGANSFHLMVVATADWTVGATPPYTLVNHGNLNRYRILVNTNQAPNNSRLGHYFDDGPTVSQVYQAADGTWVDGNPHILEMVRHNTDGKFRIYIDGNLEVETAIPGGFGTVADVTQNFLVGAAPAAGTDTQQNWPGKYGDVFLLKGELTPEDLAGMRSYLTTKWSI
jgi:hypothetical protein